MLVSTTPFEALNNSTEQCRLVIPFAVRKDKQEPNYSLNEIIRNGKEDSIEIECPTTSSAKNSCKG